LARVCIAKPSPGGNGVAGHSAPDLPTHRIAAMLHSSRQRCAMTAQLYVSTCLPTGCECTDRCQRWYRSLRVPTDGSWTQTDRYHHCSECVCAHAPTGDGRCPRVHCQAFPWRRWCGWALCARPAHASHRRHAAQREAALRYDGAALREYDLAYRLRVHRSVQALVPIVARANR
jgi:hypothetical protein